MQQFKIIKSFEQIKLLADTRRLAILRKLMAETCYIDPIGGRHWGNTPPGSGIMSCSWNRRVWWNWLKLALPQVWWKNFIVLVAGGLLLQELILPDNPSIPSVIFSGSHDLAVELLARQLGKTVEYHDPARWQLGWVGCASPGSMSFFRMPSYWTCNGEYNLPFIRRIFPDRSMLVFILAGREQGLMTAPGNPKTIRSLQDLARSDVSFINRNPRFRNTPVA